MGLAEVNSLGKPFAVDVEAQDESVEVVGDRLFTARAGDGTSALVSYCGTHELGGTPDQNIKGVVKVNCGMNRNEVDYFAIAQKAVEAAGLEGQVAIFALGPRTDADIFAEKHIDGLPDDLEQRKQQFAWWTTRGPVVRNWKNGDNAFGPSPVSWYAVHDQFENEVCTSEQFENLEWVVDLGNSAQGQGGQRRTAVGRGPDSPVSINPKAAIVNARGIKVRRIDSNGSGNVFFDGWRPGPLAPGYNNWRSGFDNAPEFVTRQGFTPRHFLGRFATRHFIMMRGEEDCKSDTIGVEIHPAALAQDPEGGPPNRFIRGLTWSQYMVGRLGEYGLLDAKTFARTGETEVGGSLHFLPVPKVGHGALDMFTSEVALTAMFGTLKEVHAYSSPVINELPPNYRPESGTI